MKHTLEVISVTHSFGHKSLLTDVNFSCTTGDTVGIFGRNGTGKSTLLKILFGTLKATQCVMNLDGQLATKQTRLNNFFAYHHQEVFLPMDSKVKNLVPLYFPDGEQQSQIFYDPAINKIENKRISLLSAGEQRYLQFLMVLNLEQPFLLLDEPFSMIEPLYKDMIIEKIISYNRIKCFIITDHYYADVLKVANIRKLIINGKMVNINDEKDLVNYGYLSPRSGQAGR